MARNKRKVYEEAVGLSDAAVGIPCAECGCRHSYVVRTMKMGGIVRRTRRCRNCGREYYTTESS